VHAGLAKQDAACGLETHGNGGIALGDVIKKEPGATGGTNAFRFKDILEGDWNAVKGPAVGARGKFGIEAGSLGEGGVGYYSNKSIEAGLELVDAVQAPAS
jgi:hypothetical protein